MAKQYDWCCRSKINLGEQVTLGSSDTYDQVTEAGNPEVVEEPATKPTRNIYVKQHYPN